MANKDNKWFKFCASDWIGDPQLRLCTLESKGLLIELMALAHHGTPYGYVNHSGQAITDMEIARLVGEPETKVKICLDELLRKTRLYEDGNGYYIKRMVEDGNQSDKYRDAGRAGGSPKLLGAEEHSGKVTVEIYMKNMDDAQKTPEVEKAVTSWIKDRAERKKALTKQAVSLQVNKLRGLKPADVVAWIKNAIEKGYSSFFPPPQDYMRQLNNQVKSASRVPVLSANDTNEIQAQLKRCKTREDFNRCVGAMQDKYKGQFGQVMAIVRAVEKEVKLV
jgi:hypothetical protein